MNQIPYNEVIFHPLSFVDTNGRLFWWKGELYRAISAKQTAFYETLFRKGIIQEFINKRILVETEPTCLRLDGYGMVIKHRAIPFVSYNHEWSIPMLKDAALLIIDMDVTLAHYGLTLQDTHSDNILFDGHRPLYVDFGSIIPLNKNTPWPSCKYNEFCRYFLYPLRLMSQGHGRIARWLLHDHDQAVFKSDFEALTREFDLGTETKKMAKKLVLKANEHVPQAIRPVLKGGIKLTKSILSKFSHTPSLLFFLQRLREEVENIKIPIVKTTWSEYYQDCFPALLPSKQWTAKHQNIYDLLHNLCPNTVLDIASNRGWYSQLAALQGIQVIAFDIDETCIAQLYYDSKKRNLSILPLVMSFTNPSPGYGLCNQWITPAIERFKCEMVLALALVHHLVFKQHLNFEQIVDGLSIFSNRWLIVEFVSREDRFVSEWWSEKFTWYTLDNFISSLKRKFRSINVLPSDLISRVLLVCEK